MLLEGSSEVLVLSSRAKDGASGGRTFREEEPVELRKLLRERVGA